METATPKSNLKAKKLSQFVPASLFAMTCLNGKPLILRAEAIDHDGLRLIGWEYVQPRAVFQIQLYFAEDARPVTAILTVSYIELSWAGYRIQAQVSCISTADAARWQKFHRAALGRHSPSYSASFRRTKFLQSQHVTALVGTLADSTAAALRQRGITVQLVSSPRDALAIARRAETQLVIGTLEEGAESAALCRGLSKLQPAPQVMLLTRFPNALGFERGLDAGASTITAQPCCPDALTDRIVEVLESTEASPKAAAPAASQLTPRTAASALATRLLGGLATFLSFARS